MKATTFLILLALSCSAAHAHPGGLDKNGCHHDGDNYHCHGSNTSSYSTPSTHSSSAPALSDPNYGKLLLEQLKNKPETRTPPVKSKQQQDYDRFMSAFDRNRHKEDTTKTEQATHHEVQGVIKRDEHGRIERSETAKNEFKRLHPCPSNGRTSGPCPGYVIDHIKPLYKGGADDQSNMQWQTIAEGKAKDKWE